MVSPDYWTVRTDDQAGNGFEASDKETVALSVGGHLLAKARSSGSALGQSSSTAGRTTTSIPRGVPTTQHRTREMG
jgi:hypothetical protein